MAGHFKDLTLLPHLLTPPKVSSVFSFSLGLTSESTTQTGRYIENRVFIDFKKSRNLHLKRPRLRFRRVTGGLMDTVHRLPGYLLDFNPSWKIQRFSL